MLQALSVYVAGAIRLSVSLSRLDMVAEAYPQLMVGGDGDAEGMQELSLSLMPRSLSLSYLVRDAQGIQDPLRIETFLADEIKVNITRHELGIRERDRERRGEERSM